MDKHKKVVLGLQHLIAMFGATVLVPILTGLNPSVALVSAGAGTLIFHAVTQGKVPVFLGSSFAFIPVIITVGTLYGNDLRYAQGGIMVAGLLYVLISFGVRGVGVHNIRRYLPPQVVGPMIMIIGLSLLPVAIDMSSAHYPVAAVTFLVALVIALRGTGFIKQLAILLAVSAGYAISAVLRIVDYTVIHEASVLSVPAFTLPRFDAGAVFIITPVVLAVLMEHVGDITMNGEVVKKDFVKDPGLHRTLLGDGLATMLAGFIGGPANTTYGENTGVLAITKNYDPSTLRLAAIFAIILGFVSKLGGVLNSIPVPVMGGISVMLFGMIALVGFNTIRWNKVAINWQNLSVMGLMLFLGLGAPYVESYFGITIGIPITENVAIQGLSLAAVAGVVLNAVLYAGKKYQVQDTGQSVN